MVCKRRSSTFRKGFFEEVLIELRCSRRVTLDEKKKKLEMENGNSPGQCRHRIE